MFFFISLSSNFVTPNWTAGGIVSAADFVLVGSANGSTKWHPAPRTLTALVDVVENIAETCTAEAQECGDDLWILEKPFDVFQHQYNIGVLIKIFRQDSTVVQQFDRASPLDYTELLIEAYGMARWWENEHFVVLLFAYRWEHPILDFISICVGT